MIPIGEEPTREENIVKSEEGNGSLAEKAPPLEEKAEEKKGKIKRNPSFFSFTTAQCQELGLRLQIVMLRPVERKICRHTEERNDN